MKKTLLLVFTALLTAQYSWAYEIGVISDIHAGKKKVRNKKNHQIVYPKKYGTCLNRALVDLKSQGVTTVIATGDIGDIGSKKKYYHAVKKKAASAGMDMVWVKGNHDKWNNMTALIPTKYYYVDRENVRIIVLDTTIGNLLRGSIDADQLSWLKQTIAEAGNKKIVIAMHHPIFDRTQRITYDHFKELHAVISSHPNIFFVLAGDWHASFSKTEGPTKYIVSPQLCSETINYQKITL